MVSGDTQGHCLGSPIRIMSRTLAQQIISGHPSSVKLQCKQYDFLIHKLTLSHALHERPKLPPRGTTSDRFSAKKEGGYVETSISDICLPSHAHKTQRKIHHSMNLLYVAMPLMHLRRLFRVELVDPGEALSHTITYQQALTESARSPLDIPRH